jgi:hypothetical protein
LLRESGDRRYPELESIGDMSSFVGRFHRGLNFRRILVVTQF